MSGWAFLVWAAVVTGSGGPGVPAGVVERASAVVGRVLGQVDGEVRLEIYSTAREMESAVARAERAGHTPLRAFAAYYHYSSRTMFCYLAPRPDPALFRARLPGPMLGALVHEAQHARAALSDPAYRELSAWRKEGEADRDAVEFLRTTDWPGRGAWEFLIESRVWRARNEGLFAPDERFRKLAPHRLPAAQRAVWYSQAYATVIGRRKPRRLPWVSWQGLADPEPWGYRLYAKKGERALLVRTRETDAPLAFEVRRVAGSTGSWELLVGFESAKDHGRIQFLAAGGVRAGWPVAGAWEWEPVRHCPAFDVDRPRSVELRGGVVRVDGVVVLHVQRDPGRVGVGLSDAVFDLRLSPAR